VIPQRNISLLSNRLAKNGERRLREDVLERDYCLAWLLAGIAESETKAVLAFKGGTALKQCYFSDYRFSEDLDFTLLEPMPFEELRDRLVPVYAAGKPRVLPSRSTGKIARRTETATHFIFGISDRYPPAMM
jgi:hypothetical protein